MVSPKDLIFNSCDKKYKVMEINKFFKCKNRKILMPYVYEKNKEINHVFTQIDDIRTAIKKYSNDLKCIIIFGSAIRKPRHRAMKPCSDIDLLLITENKYTENEYFNTEKKKEFFFEKLSTGSCYYTSYNYGNLDLINRSIDQVMIGVKNGKDTISINALYEGIIIAKDNDFDLPINNKKSDCIYYYNDMICIKDKEIQPLYNYCI